VPQDVFVLRSGRVKVSAVASSGRQVLLAFRGPGDLVGELSALDERPRSASIVALEPVEPWC
jgi:CRP/FNR family transcriptional regulator, cyclic AMP receptor protein